MCHKFRTEGFTNEIHRLFVIEPSQLWSLDDMACIEAAFYQFPPDNILCARPQAED